jgi:hypothetical protein
MQPYSQGPQKFINNTNLDDTEAFALLDRMRRLFIDHENVRQDRIRRAERAMRIWRGELWDEQDLKMFEALGAQPYVFRQYRTMFNSLINRQRNRRFTFELVPRDIHTYKRMRDGRDEYIAKHRDEFHSDDEAGEYYDRFADDEFAQAVTGMMEHYRHESKAKYVESETFEQGIVTGLAFLKTIYSNRFNREGGIEINSVPQRKMIYDENAVRYDLADAEYIGEVHLLYKDELKAMFPDWTDAIEENYKRFTNIGNGYRVGVDDQTYSNFYKYDTTNDRTRVRLCEIWTKTTEERIKVIDTETGEERIAAIGLGEEDVWDGLYQVALLDLIRPLQAAGDFAAMQDPSLREQSIQAAQERFSLQSTREEVWFKTVFTYDAIWQHERSPFPHGCHPYTPFFPQHTDGYFTSLMDDVADVIIALNKALMFRELILGHSAKGLVVVDADTLAQSGYDVDDVADAYTQIGGVLVLKLKPGKNLDNAIRQMNNTGQGLNEINSMINSYVDQLEYIVGVNRAQQGIASADAPAARYRMELAEGESNNGLMYDNFVRTLETHYNDKFIPLVVEIMRARPDMVIRLMGDGVKGWITADLGETLDVFSDAVRTGAYSLVIRPVNDTPQISAARSSQYFQLALNGLIPLETAFEFSDDPNRAKIIRSIKKENNRKMMEAAASQVMIQDVQRIAMEMGLDPQAATEMATKLQLTRMKELDAQKKRGPQSLPGEQMAEIQSTAAEPTRLQTIEDQTIT